MSLKATKESIKTKLAAIRAAFASDAAAPAPAAGTVYTLADGTTQVTIDTLAVGGKITPAPAAAGTCTLQDGTAITYDATGTITAVTPAIPAADDDTSNDEMKTPEQMQKFLENFSKRTVESKRKFFTSFSAQLAVTKPAAAGVTSQPDMQKIVTVLRAVFENVFSWDLKNAKENLDKAQAIQIYQQGFKKDVAPMETKLAAQEKAINSLFELIEQISDMEVTDKTLESGGVDIVTDEQFEKMSNLEKFRYEKAQKRSAQAGK